MIRITVLPERKTYVIDKNEIRAKDLLYYLDIDEPDSVALVINNQLIDLEKEGETMIRSHDKVLLIRQATGG